MASTRAADVAEILWELKRADKVATFSTIAVRAGFSAGSHGKTVQTAIRTVRRDWPHLQWWRAINDDGLLEKDSEHVEKLRDAGYELESIAGNETSLTLAEFEAHLMEWADAVVGDAQKG